MTKTDTKISRNVATRQVVLDKKGAERWESTLTCGHKVIKPFWENLDSRRKADVPVRLPCKRCIAEFDAKQVSIFDLPSVGADTRVPDQKKPRATRKKADAKR